jgi:hypothetical protein
MATKRESRPAAVLEIPSSVLMPVLVLVPHRSVD